VVPLSVGDFVQENSGVVTTPNASCVVSLPSGTTAGNTLLVFIGVQSGLTPPTGFIVDKNVGGLLYAYRKSEVAAGETSWTFTALSGAVPWTWYVAEMFGVDPVEPLDASATSSSGVSVANGGTLSTGTTPLNAALDTVVFGAFTVNQVNGGDTHSWSGYTNDFEELLDIAPGVGGSYQLAVARKFVTGTTGQFSTTATLATSTGTASCSALVVAYRAVGSPMVAPLAMFAGFGQGTDGGATATGGAASLYGAAVAGGAGAWGTNLLVQSGGRTGSYRFRVVQSGAAAYRRLGDLNVKAGALGWNVRVVSATGTVVVNEIANNASTVIFAQLLYDTSTSKFGVRCGTTGTVSWQSGTTALNTWVWVDLRPKVNTTTWQVDWTLETGTDTYTAQTQATLSGQSSGFSFHVLHLGGNAAQTMTADYADVCLSAYYVAYPLGPHEVRLLTVDPAGTPTLSGTSTNFSVFTANGTLAAWNAVNARNAVDEVPPTVSASADGVCQTAVAATDYIEFPMAPCVLADDEIVSGVRSLVPMWGGTGTGTGTVGVRGWDGTTETVLTPASTSYDAGAPTVVSSTEPRWECAMWPSPNGWTQAELDTLALRFGFSTDATPDMGTHALYLEYATRKAITTTVIGEAGGVELASNVNPNTTGVRSLVTTTPSDQGTTLNWTDAGGPHTQPVAASSIDTQTLDAEAGEVSFVEVVSENELADRE
jgi:hypothetical protein